MAEGIRFEIKSGTGKIILLLIIAVLVLFTTFRRGRTLETEAAEEIRQYIQHGSYMTQALNEFENAGGLEAENVDELARDLIETAEAEVEIVSIKARGNGSRPVARVEILIGGQAPAGEDAVQYFKMRYSGLTGWKVEHKTSAMAYYLSFP